MHRLGGNADGTGGACHIGMATLAGRQGRFPFENLVARIQYETLAASLAASVVFGLVEMGASVILGGDALAALRAPASLLIRERAYESTGLALTLLLGIIIHASLAVWYGFAFGLAISELKPTSRVSRKIDALWGLGFGALLWFVNFEIVARAIYPWLFAMNQVGQLAAHVLAYGLPLALLFGRLERRRLARVDGP